MACCLSLTMSAKVAYILPNGCDINNEFSFHMDANSNERPEWQAAQWFKAEYVDKGTGKFLTVDQFNVADNLTDVDVVWIYVDRFHARVDDNTNNWFRGCILSDSGDGALGFGPTFQTNLKSFLNKGGKAFVSKQAVVLLEAISRVDNNRFDFNCTALQQGIANNDTWNIVTCFTLPITDWEHPDVVFDNHNHPIFADLNFDTGTDRVIMDKDIDNGWVGATTIKNLTWAGTYRFEAENTTSGYRTDNNCNLKNYAKEDKRDAWGLRDVQNQNNCRVLGGWGHTPYFEIGGIVEFYPTNAINGTIITNGLAAYSWYSNNGKLANIKTLTKNTLDYLSNTPNGKDGGETETKMSDIFLGDWCYPASLATENHSFRTIHPTVSGWTTNNWIAGDQTSVADIMYVNDANKLVFKQEGTVTLHTTITEDRELQAWPKGTYEYTHDVTFTYSSSAQAVADADLSSNGLDGSEGKFMVLHKNMRGMDSLAYTISFDDIDGANRAEVRKVQDGEYTRLVFDKAGTVKLNIRLNEPNFREEWAKGEHVVTKKVTFVQPAFTWSHTPDEAALNEDKPAVVVTCDNVPGATVKYESSDPTIASVNETTGKISYIKEGTTQINAYIEINGVKFESTKENVTVTGLNITWTTAPAETAIVGKEMTIAAAPQYGSATISYETHNCTYADGKLSFLHAGTATVRPYAVVNEHEYEGETKTIIVSPDLKWKDGHPQSGFVGEPNKVAEATTNEGEETIVYSSSKPEKVAVDAKTGALTYLGYDEACVVTITATVTIDEKDYSISGEVNANLPNVMWTTEPAANGYVGQTMDIAAQLQYLPDHAVGFETTNCSYDAVTKKLTIGEGETATVRPYVELTTANKKYYGAEKSITITTPAVTWTHEPDEAAVMEDKPAAQAECNIDKLTVYYRSLNTEVATINAETGKISYLKPSGEEGSDPYGTVTIEAYVTIGETEYKDTKAIKIFGPKADWVTRPATTIATVGDVVDIAGRVRYGAAALGFDYADEYIEYTAATETESAKIKFLKAGTTTIRPYAEAYGAKYYNNETATADKMGEEITITVAPDLKWVAGNPMSACVGETGKTAIATTTDGTIVYSSSDAEKVSVDSEGNLTFHAYETACKVTIFATVTIGETPYQISGEIDANLPNVYWVDDKKPGETYRKDETPAAEAKLEYGPGVVNYEVSNCSWAADKLTFAAEGTATVQPYVEYESHKYYGDKVTINVTPATTTYTRTVTPGRYGTICLERTPKQIEGCTFWQPESVLKDGSTVVSVQLVEVKVGDEALKAGYGYFFLATDSEIRVTMSLADEALDDPVVHNAQKGIYTHGMHGTFGDILYVPNDDPNECILSNNELRYGKGLYVQDHRAYIKLNEVPDGPTAAPGRRRVTMGVNQPSVTTDMELIPLDGEHATKVMINGQIYILRADRIYTVDGQLVK